MADPLEDQTDTADSGELDTTQGNWSSWGSYDPFEGWNEPPLDSGEQDTTQGNWTTTNSDPTKFDWSKVGDWFKNVLTGQGSIADYGTLLTGAMGLYEYLNKDRSPKTWQGTLSKGTYVPPTVSPQYYSGIMSRGYGERAMGVNPFTGGRYIAPTTQQVYGAAPAPTPAPAPSPTPAPAPSPTPAPAPAPASQDAISNLYTNVLSRTAEPEGYSHWKATLGPSVSSPELVQFLTAAAPELAGTTYAPLAGKTVTDLYQNVLGRAPEAEGLAYWTNLFGPTVEAEEVQKFLAGAAPELAATKYAGLVTAAQGGLMGLAKGGQAMPPRYLRGETDGMADQLPSSIDGRQPAKLSHGEFVVPADVVSHLGNGNSDAGAKVLYKMMDRVRQARTGTKRQGKQIKPEKFMPGGIANIPRYSGGGAVAFPDGGAVPPASGGTSAGGLSPWVGDYVAGPQGFLSKAWALGDQPYQAYQGPLTAGTSPLQQKYYQGLESMGFPSGFGATFSGAPTMPGAASGTAGGTGGGIAGQYMNPYLSAALQPQLDEIRRQADISRSRLGAKFGGAGGGYSAMSGGRHGIESAELERSMLGEMGKTLSSGYATAYDKAREQFNTEQRQKQAQAEMLAGAGREQQAIEQQAVDAQLRQFQEAQQWPYKQLEFQRNLLAGLPVGTQTMTPTTSGFSDLLGGIGSLLKLRELLGG